MNADDAMQGLSGAFVRLRGPTRCFARRKVSEIVGLPCTCGNIKKISPPSLSSGSVSYVHGRIPNPPKPRKSQGIAK